MRLIIGKCFICKKLIWITLDIRNKGFEVSHGLCEKCAKKKYGQYYDI